MLPRRQSRAVRCCRLFKRAGVFRRPDLGKAGELERLGCVDVQTGMRPPGGAQNPVLIGPEQLGQLIMRIVSHGLLRQMRQGRICCLPLQALRQPANSALTLPQSQPKMALGSTGTAAFAANARPCVAASFCQAPSEKSLSPLAV